MLVKRSGWIWIAALVLMLAAVLFQRQTGPTYPKKVSFQVDDSTYVALKLPRSYSVGKPLRLEMPPLPWDWTARLYHKPYPKDTAWTQEPAFWPEDKVFVSYIPEVNQKAAKLEYYIEIENFTTGQVFKLPSDAPVVIRFKGSVPAWALLPHIVLMFIAMIFSNVAGLMAAFKNNAYKLWSFITLVFILVGGLIFGPIVQLYAFDHLWTGFPFGYDLTDNKTLVMFIFWGIAVLLNLKKPRPWPVVIASLVTLFVYCVPHSLRGSEFNYDTGQIVTGIVTTLKWLL